jgi:hypothetical protein
MDSANVKMAIMQMEVRLFVNHVIILAINVQDQVQTNALIANLIPRGLSTQILNLVFAMMDSGIMETLYVKHVISAVLLVIQLHSV